MSAMRRHKPSPLLAIYDGIARIPEWGWDSTQSTLQGISVRADVNKPIRVIPEGGNIVRALYLTFPNGWVLSLTPPFSDSAEMMPGGVPPLAAAAYAGEANRVFDPDTYRSLEMVTDTVALDSLIRETASQPQWARDEMVSHYIETNPRHAGIADAIVAPAGIPVWALVGAVMRREATLQEIARDYGISLAVMRAALAYYQRHHSVIDARIAANDISTA